MLSSEMKTGVLDSSPRCKITSTLFQLVDDCEEGNAEFEKLQELNSHIEACPYCNPEFQKLLGLVQANKPENYVLKSLKLIGKGMGLEFIVLPIIRGLYKDVTTGQ